MHAESLHHRAARRLIRLVSPLVPADVRHDWRREWESELASLEDGPVAKRRFLRHASGAFADAFWIRQRRVADAACIDDLRHGWRQMRQDAGFALTAIGILAVGMAASITAFSVVSQILLRPLPYPDQDRLVTVWERSATSPARQEVAPGNFLDWKARTRTFEILAAAAPSSLDFTSADRPEVWRSAAVTEGFFAAFGVRPLLGRTFRPDEHARGRNRVVILRASLWRTRFGASPSIVGRVLTLDEHPHEVIGVMPDDFAPMILEDTPGDVVAWTPKVILEFEPRIRSTGYWQVVGRIAPGRTLEEAGAELDAIAMQLEREYPRTNTGSRVSVTGIREHLVGEGRQPVLLFAGAVALVLLIACVNVTNLMLARGSARRQEISIRSALGASRPRIVAQLLAESLLLAAAAGGGALVLAHGAIRALATWGPRHIQWIDTLHVDGSAVAFALLLAVVVAVVAGLVPAVRLASSGVRQVGLRTMTADRQQQRLRSILVAAEVALALMMIVGTGLLLRSFVNLLAIDAGFHKEHVAVLQVFATSRQQGTERLREYLERSVAGLQRVPGVEQVGAVSAMPFIETNLDIRSTFRIIGTPPPAEGAEPRTSVTIATPAYFQVMRIPVKRGRGLEPSDGPLRPLVAVISETLAEEHWPDANPIGQRVAFQFEGRSVEVEVVGVVGALRHRRLDETPRTELFVPFSQRPYGSMTFVAKTSVPPASVIPAAQEAVWNVDPLQTFYRVATLDELVGRTLNARRFALTVLAGFAAVSLLLAVAGLYGVLTAISTQYRREIGVRMALGARWVDIVRLVLGRGVAVVGVGLFVGVAGALSGSRLLEGMLYSVTPWDPAAIVGAAALMLLVAVPACYVPARRAARANPLDALRLE